MIKCPAIRTGYDDIRLDGFAEYAHDGLNYGPFNVVAELEASKDTAKIAVQLLKFARPLKNKEQEIYTLVKKWQDDRYKTDHNDYKTYSFYFYNVRRALTKLLLVLNSYKDTYDFYEKIIKIPRYAMHFIDMQT